MRRTSTTIGVLAILAVALAGVSPGVLAQGTDPAAAGHPVVGAWLIETTPDDPTDAPTQAIFHADGTFMEFEAGHVSIGVWQPTGERSAALTVIFYQPDPSGGGVSSGKLRGTLEVSDDGGSFTATGTFEFTSPDGTPSGELGPALATGTRIAFEAMGTPVGPLPAELPGPAASPGASPTGSVVDVTLQEFAVLPAVESVAAGAVMFNVTNDGPNDLHELVVISTDLAPDALPTTAEGGVDENGAGITIIGEIEEFAPGETKSATFDLAAGSYVLICNLVEEEDGAIESHYQSGMYVPFTVT